jgi:probable addiction module antidote protein
MPKRTRPHEEFLAEYLQDPRDVALYLNAALEDSEEAFLEAIGDVAATVATMAEVADRAGIARQAAYRMLSRTGNPTYGSLIAILKALGLRLAIEADIVDKPGRGVGLGGETYATDTALPDGGPPESIPTDERAEIYHAVKQEFELVVCVSGPPKFVPQRALTLAA